MNKQLFSGWVWAISLLLFISLLPPEGAGQSNEELQKEVTELREQVSDMRHQFDQLAKGIDDLAWRHRLGEVAHIDKVYLTGPPKGKKKGQKKATSNNDLYETNPLRFQTYVFIPRSVDPDRQYPLLVLPHGGVHSNFNTYYTHILRELLAQGYLVVAPEYRGSTGYGRGFYEAIDYGGLEVADVKAARDFMLENYAIVDSDRVGILGWSHGGLITLMNIFEYPDSYKAAYAGVPVSDLIARMGYKTQRYRELYSVDYHIGESAYENPAEYRRRSPAWQAHKLQDTPLLIHTNTNDSDVNVLEVEHLINNLKAEGKQFEYEIYEDVPGGHAFDRIDTRFAREVRLKVYRFLARYLEPPQPFENLKDLSRAGYGF